MENPQDPELYEVTPLERCRSRKKNVVYLFIYVVIICFIFVFGDLGYLW
jgi:hypothetical protein